MPSDSSPVSANNFVQDSYASICRVLIVVFSFTLGLLSCCSVHAAKIKITQLPCPYGYTKNALCAFSPVGVLIVTTREGIVYYSPDENDIYIPTGVLPIDEWYAFPESSVGGLILKWDTQGIILGPDIDALMDTGLEKRGDTRFVSEATNIGKNQVRVRRLSIPSQMLRVGDMLPESKGQTYAYDSVADEVICFDQTGIVYKSPKLKLTKSLLNIFHDLSTERDYEARNLWLAGFVDDKLVCISQVDGEVLLLSRDLKSVERFGSISNGGTVWQPSLKAGMLAAVYGNPQSRSRYGGDYLMTIWNLNSNKIEENRYKVDLRGLAGSGGWYPAIALRDNSKGAIIWGNIVALFNI